jgi:hypothetical protein
VEKVQPLKDFKEVGFDAAVMLSGIEARGVKNGHSEHFNEIAAFAENIGALVKDGQLELLLVQYPDGEQSALPIILLEEVVEPN